MLTASSSLRVPVWVSTPDCQIFRGTDGFWRAYPALGTAGIRFEEIASPQSFRSEPALAWAFYGHRLDLYRRTQPHRGFGILRGWAGKMPRGGFVFTSNVDGHFQKAGFAEDRVAECHGTIHWLQCVDECSQRTWPADDVVPVVDEHNFRLISPVPKCPSCGAVARPNILMFNDSHWVEGRTNQQIRHLETWIAQCEKLVAVEVGKHPAISSGFLFFGVRAYVSTIRKRTRAHYFPRHFDRAHTAHL